MKPCAKEQVYGTLLLRAAAAGCSLRHTVHIRIVRITSIIRTYYAYYMYYRTNRAYYTYYRKYFM